MNTYEAWRISYQSSESAAQAAWKEMIRLHHRVNELESAIKKQVERSNDLSWYMHDQITAQQAAWIEWQHGNGADAAMNWIHNGLVGPGHIPDGTDPQKWFDANCADALRLADKYEAHGFLGDHRFAQDHWCRQAAAELGRLHAENQELKEQMAAIGAGGVESLRKRAEAAPQAVQAAVHPAEGATAQAVKLLAADHSGMKVDYRGLFSQVQRALKRTDPGHAEMLRQLEGHLQELGQRWYAGDTAVVDELLQLYSVECQARDALAAQAEQEQST